MRDHAFIVRVRPEPNGSGFRASVQDMTRGGHVPAYAVAANGLAAVFAAFVEAKLGPPLEIPADVFDAFDRSQRDAQPS